MEHTGKHSDQYHPSFSTRVVSRHSLLHVRQLPPPAPRCISEPLDTQYKSFLAEPKASSPLVTTVVRRRAPCAAERLGSPKAGDQTFACQHWVSREVLRYRWQPMSDPKDEARSVNQIKLAVPSAKQEQPRHVGETNTINSKTSPFTLPTKLEMRHTRASRAEAKPVQT